MHRSAVQQCGRPFARPAAVRHSCTVSWRVYCNLIPRVPCTLQQDLLRWHCLGHKDCTLNLLHNSITHSNTT